MKTYSLLKDLKFLELLRHSQQLLKSNLYKKNLFAYFIWTIRPVVRNYYPNAFHKLYGQYVGRQNNLMSELLVLTFLQKPRIQSGSLWQKKTSQNIQNYFGTGRQRVNTKQRWHDGAHANSTCFRRCYTHLNWTTTITK